MGTGVSSFASMSVPLIPAILSNIINRFWKVTDATVLYSCDISTFSFASIA